MKKKTKKILFIIIGIVAILLLNRVGGSFIKNTFYTITSPGYNFLLNKGDKIGGWLGGVFTAGHLKKENQEFAKQNILLKKELSDFREYKKTAEILRQALSLREETGLEVIPTNVALFQPETESILITTGKDSGIREGMAVITEQGALVGVVKKVSNNFSSVTLISSSELTFDVQIYTTSTKDTLAVARGAGNGKIYFGLVPQKDELNKGDIVRTTSLGGKFPKDILVGEIDIIRKNDAESFQEGTIIPYFILTELRHLFLVTNFKKLENE